MELERPGQRRHDRREFLALSAKASLALGAAAVLPRSVLRTVAAAADAAVAGLSDPALQPMFATLAPNALDPGFRYQPARGGSSYRVGMFPAWHETGLVGTGGAPLRTEVFGYGTSASDATWPGRTFELQANQLVQVEWRNELVDGSGSPVRHPIYGNAAGGVVRDVVDTSLHWCYNLHGYEHYTIDRHGVPVVVHVHGGHSHYLRDGNPEYFFSPGYRVTGPRWSGPVYQYANDQGAGNLWYHDHALGITRLNVYAGLAGFYFLRDDVDTGKPGNLLGLPAGAQELAYAIQDRMFTASGQLFYPSWPEDPAWDDFITGEGVTDPPTPSALAEFFGDHLVVNGKVWPKVDVEPRQHRIHLLNGCDSRFLIVGFRQAASPTSETVGTGGPLPLTVVGSDQGLAKAPAVVHRLVIGPGERYDVVFDFAAHAGQRIILDNVGGDEPYGGVPGAQVFERTDRIMAFDVAGAAHTAVPFALPGWAGNTRPVDRVRRLALFEGSDDRGRLQPLLGTAEPATDAQGTPITWPDTPAYAEAGLVGQMQGAIGWHSPTTENPSLGATEIWEIWNVTEDAHPIHLHLVHFEVLDRQDIAWHPETTEEDRVLEADPGAGGGTYLVAQPVVQHDGSLGEGFRLANLTLAGEPQPADPVEGAPKDTATALPGQVTRLKATFDKPGRFVWHCHILSHEDHEMMRPFEVGAISGRAARP